MGSRRLRDQYGDFEGLELQTNAFNRCPCGAMPEMEVVVFDDLTLEIPFVDFGFPRELRAPRARRHRRRASAVGIPQVTPASEKKVVTK